MKRAEANWLALTSLACLCLLVLSGVSAPLVRAQSTSQTSIAIPNRPLFIVYDSNKGEMFVAEDYSTNDTISVVSDASDRVVANISLKSQSQGGGATLGALAYDSNNGEIFAYYSVSAPGCFCSDEYVAVISDANNSVVANVSLGTSTVGGYGYVVYDSGKGEVFATINDSLAVISAANDTVVGTVSVGNGPVGLAYDSANGEILVADSRDFDGAVAVVSDSNNTVVANITSSQIFNAAGITYDSAKNEAFVTPFGYYYNTTVLVYSATTDSMVAEVAIPYEIDIHPLAAYDSAKGEIFVPDGSKVCAISDSSNTLLGCDSVLPNEAANAAYDSSKGEIFLTDWDNNALVIIPDTASLSSSTTTSSPSVTATTSTSSSSSSSSTSSTSTPEFPFAPVLSTVAVIGIVGGYLAMRRNKLSPLSARRAHV